MSGGGPSLGAIRKSVELSGESDALISDLPRKCKFLEEFAKHKVVGPTLKAINMRRHLFREWLTCEWFVQKFQDALEDVSDELLHLALAECGLVKGRKKGINTTVLLAFLKNHSRLKDSGAGAGATGPAQIHIHIKGADDSKLMKVVGNEKAAALPAPEIPAIEQQPEASA